jgi:hypothetical protein
MNRPNNDKVNRTKNTDRFQLSITIIFAIKELHNKISTVV